MAHDVFISYSHQDKQVADAICATLEGQGVRCWIAPRDVMPGSEWSESIIEAIHESRIMVLLFSSHSNVSQQVRREAERAVNKGIALVPFRVEDVPLSKSMEYFMSTTHWLDALTPPLEKHLQSLVQAVRALLEACGGGRRLADPGFTPPMGTAPHGAPSNGTSSAPASAGLMPSIAVTSGGSDTPRLITWDQETLQAAERRLAEYIGPLARVLVKKAARQAVTLPELYQSLAQSIPSEVEKNQFLSKIPR